MNQSSKNIALKGRVSNPDAYELDISGPHGEVEFGRDVVLLGRTRIRFREGGGRLVLGNKVQLQGFFDIGDGSTVRIGAASKINRQCKFIALEGACIHLGRRCLLSNATLRTCDMHSILDLEGNRINPSRSITLENKVWLAENTYVAKGVSIGHDTVIAANSVVTKSIPPHVIAAGNPARIVRSDISWHRKRLPIPTQGATGDGARPEDLPAPREPKHQR